MSENQMESTYAVNPANRQESAIHAEIYGSTKHWDAFEKLNAQAQIEINPNHSDNTKWATFEKLSAQANGRNSSYLDMSASDPYETNESSVKAPEVGDPKRLDFRQERQQNAIFDGIKSGEINFDEFSALENEQDLISRVQEYFGADGLSKQELKNLDELQNNARQHIIDAGGADELMYGGESAEEPESEKPSEHKAPKEHGSEEKPEEHGSKPEEHGTEGTPEQPGGEAEKFQQFMNFLDQNADGQISLEELLQAFQAIDENQDGSISQDELQKFMEKFATSPQHGEKQSGGEEEPSEEEPSGGKPEGTGEDLSEPSETHTPSESTNDGSDEQQPTDGEKYADAEQMKLIYIFPNSQQEWQKLNQDAPEGSIIVTLPSKDVSWDSDKPFDSMDPELQRNIAEASANGLNPMGYVGTRGATRPIEEVKAEIDSWYANADVKGIYLGDSGNHSTNGGYHTDPATEAYFQELGDYIQARGGIAMVNGSGSPNPDYVNKFIQGTHEGYPSGMPESQDWQDGHPPGRFAAMLVGVQQQDIGKIVQQSRENHNGYVGIAPEYGQAPTENEAYWNEVIRSLRG